MTKGGKGGFLGEKEEKEDTFWEKGGKGGKGGPFSYQLWSDKTNAISFIIQWTSYVDRVNSTKNYLRKMIQGVAHCWTIGNK